MTGTINDLLNENRELKDLSERQFKTITLLMGRWSVLRVWLVDQHNLSPDDREGQNPNAVQAKMNELEGING